MAFDTNEFINKTLTSGLNNGSFTADQVSIYSFNYLQRGLITQDTFDEISQAVTDYNNKQAEIAKEQAEAQAAAEAEANGYEQVEVKDD